MSKYSITIFLSFLVFSAYSQNKKELNASILRLKSDSTLLSNKIAEKKLFIYKNTVEIENLNNINKSNNSEIDSLKKTITEIQISFSSMKKKADSLISIVKIADSLKNIVKIAFPSFLLNKTISSYGCDLDGGISFYTYNDNITISGDHWGGPISNVTYDKIRKEINIQFTVYHEGEDAGESSMKIRFGERGEIFEVKRDGGIHSVKLCDGTGNQINYIFKEIDLLGVDYTESQNFGEEVFRALREGDYEKMEKFLPTSSDLVYFEGVFLNENSTESERQNIKDELSEVQKNRISESKSLFEDARLEVLDQGMSWNDIKFKKIELSDVRLNGELVYRANILIHFDYFGAEHILELDDCFKAERTWLVGDGLFLD